MIDCTECIYEYSCDWEEAESGKCKHYRPDIDHKTREMNNEKN